MNNNNFLSINDKNNCSVKRNLCVYNRYVCRDGISPHHITQYRNHISNISTNTVNSNKNSLSTLSVNYIGYFYHVFPLHPNTFHELFYNHTLPGIEKFKFEIYFFTSNISAIVTTQIECLHQFQSIISEFQNDIDCYIEELNKNISDLSKFNSIVTKCVKSYLCKYVKSITTHYCSCYNSIMQNIKTFKCIQQCVKSMLPLVSGDRGSKGYVKGLFTYVSYDGNIKSTISRIDANLPIGRINLINVYLNALANSKDGSNNIDTTIWQLTQIKNYTSQFSGHILNYNTIKWFLITPLSRLISKEREIKTFNDSNGNGISNKYDAIKPKVEYCKSSLQFENQRLESISNNAIMLQKQLELLISMINKHKTNTEKLEQFRYKLNRMKENKDRSMNYLCRTVQMVTCNLYDISRISNCLNSGKNKMSITTIKQDIDNINSSIKDINNILSVIRSQLIMLDPINLGIDCKVVNEVECFINEIVFGIHKKYCCVSSELSTVFAGEHPSVATLVDGCQLSKITECTCAPQTGAQTCAPCQDCQSDQRCASCESIKKLLSFNDTTINQKVESINKVICRLIGDKPKDGCNTGSENQCPHICQTNQGGQVTSSCQTTQQPETTGSTSCQGKTITELIKSTLNEIKQCQTSPAVKCEGQEDVKCTETLDKTCQISSVAQSTPSCSSTTSQGVVSCKDLDNVKLCVDTMINKCNCPHLKELLKGQNIKSFVDVFKWLIISNFRELFCLYLFFDRSILNEISCCLNKLEDIKTITFYFNLAGFGMHFSLDCIKNQMTESIKKVESIVDTMKSGIRQLECAIEGVAMSFIGCSLVSNSIHHINGNISNHYLI